MNRYVSWYDCPEAGVQRLNNSAGRGQFVRKAEKSGRVALTPNNNTLQNQANNGWKWQHIHVSPSVLLSPYKPERQGYCAIMLHVVASFGTYNETIRVACSECKARTPNRIDRNALSPKQRAPLNYCASRMQVVHWSGAVTNYRLQNSVWSWSLRRGAMARDWSLSVMVVKQWGKTTLKSLDDVCNRTLHSSAGRAQGDCSLNALPVLGFLIHT